MIKFLDNLKQTIAFYILLAQANWEMKKLERLMKKTLDSKRKM